MSATVTLVFVSILACIATIQAQNDCKYGDTYPLTVSTTIGSVQGTYYNGSRAFLGIPFAQPPLGNLRFAPAVPIGVSSSTIVATNWPNACYQAGVATPVGYTQSEDCLYLNVFTPTCHSAVPGAGSLPVMVFIHGGRYWTGYTEQFPGDLLAAEKGAVVVTIQYRLNIFGFQSFDDNTNLGLKDQQLALKWVKDNAAYFGGDSNAITVFGESAGASSVLYHLIAPSSYPYYNRVIQESTWQWLIPTVETSRQEQTTIYAPSRGCSNTTNKGTPDYKAILACLRSLPAAKLNPSTAEANFMVPMVDRTFIPSLPLQAIKQGKFNKDAQIIIGHNYQEGNFMAYSRLGFKGPDQVISNATYLSVVNKTLLVYLDQAAADYIIQQYEPVRAQLGNYYGGAQFFGDYYIICGSIIAAKYLSAHNANFKTYIFNYTSPDYHFYDQYFLAASHGNELPYVFLEPIYTYYNFTYTDNVMADRMSSAWVDFAKYSTPAFSPYQYPHSIYFGPDAFGFYDTVKYKKDICSIWKQFFELY